jgi:aerobic carbon-monoxide dehydrogenase medium subunit
LILKNKVTDMNNFTYVEPSTMEEALEFLKEHGDESKILGGGCSLVLLLKEGFVTPDYVVSLRKIPGLQSVTHEHGHLRIGAMVPHRVLEVSDEIKAIQPMLSEMAACIGQVQVRNLGTIGGNLCHAEYRADPPAAMVALDATVELTSTGGARTIAVEDLIRDYYTTDIRSNEILTQIVIPDLPPKSFSKYVRVSARSVMEEPTVTVAAVAVPDGVGRLKEVRLALGAVASRPFRVHEAEALLISKPLSEAIMKEAASIAANASNPMDDMHGPADWKRELVKVYVYRVLKMIETEYSQEAAR